MNDSRNVFIICMEMKRNAFSNVFENANCQD